MLLQPRIYHQEEHQISFLDIAYDVQYDDVQATSPARIYVQQTDAKHSY